MLELVMGIRVFFLCVYFVTVNSWTQDDYARFLVKLSSNETLNQEFYKHSQLFKEGHLRREYNFPCKVLPPSTTTPTSVHKLRPGDINVVAAIGDSLTAGNGITACTILGLLRQDRGLAWSIGGEESYEKQPTIPNIIQKYNPNVKGFATGSGGVVNRHAHLDLAEPGAHSRDMPDQARYLIHRMKSDDSIDFVNDWKLITVFVGGNDLCDYCDDTYEFDVYHYKNNLQKTLDIFYKRVPRAFINLVEVLHVETTKHLNKGIICPIMHFFLCRCGAFPKNEKAENRLKAETALYQTATNDLVSSGRYDAKDDFTVVVQPFFEKTTLPMKPGTEEPDLGYFAPDCFHLSRLGQAAAATALWNNMVEALEVKKTDWITGEGLECPTEANPYLYTKKNSGLYRT